MMYTEHNFPYERKFNYVKTAKWILEGLELHVDRDPRSILFGSVWLYYKDRLIGSASFSKTGIRYNVQVLDRSFSAVIPFSKIEFVAQLEGGAV